VRRLLLVTILAGLLTGSTLFAQSGTAEPPATPAPAVDSVALEPQGFTYDPGTRRDPFVSLLRRGADAGPSAARGGLAGLGAAEVNLRGTLESRGSYLGILQGSDAKTYIVRAGDRLLDGTIRSISADAMVILQQVDDPLSVDKEREVRKILRQMEEAK
jgi:Tfp pilus assembly protein PilP